MNLPCEERRQFATWFYEHEKEILEVQVPEDSEAALSAEQEAGLLRRRGLSEAHPARLEPWAGTAERLPARRDELRAQKAAAAEADEHAAVGAMRNVVEERAGIIDSPLTNPSHFYDLTPLPSVLESRCLK